MKRMARSPTALLCDSIMSSWRSWWQQAHDISRRPPAAHDGVFQLGGSFLSLLGRGWGRGLAHFDFLPTFSFLIAVCYCRERKQITGRRLKGPWSPNVGILALSSSLITHPAAYSIRHGSVQAAAELKDSAKPGIQKGLSHLKASREQGRWPRSARSPYVLFHRQVRTEADGLPEGNILADSTLLFR